MNLFTFWEQFGFHVTLSHFYEPIPEISSLDENVWNKKTKLIGIDINEEEQISLLNSFKNQFQIEYKAIPREKPTQTNQYYIKNGSFESVDGEILYCMIRYFKPQTVIETGSGFTTLLSSQALLKNIEESGLKSKFIAIEPYPSNFLKLGLPGFVKLISKKIQEIPLSFFSELKENDILFIDTSHVVKIGSDVQYLFLEVIPRLSKGVIVHIHDIFLPSEYPKALITKSFRFYNEQYFLQSFLTFNKHYKIIWAGSYMHLTHPSKLKEAFSSYNKSLNWPGSFWIKKVL